MSEKHKTDLPFPERPHVLIVDDDARIRDLLYRYLSKNGFIVIEAEHADQADEMLKLFDVDIMIVDVMMPGRTGFEFVKNIRQAIDTPVIFLTAMGEHDDKLTGFETGGDDYLVKPFEPKELLYRIQAILRRVPSQKDESLKPFKMGDLYYDIDNQTLQNNGESIVLTEGDITLLEALALKKGETVDRFELADTCGVDPDGRNIDVQVTRLRRKIETDTRNPRYLKTVRGVGYALKAEYD
jgi:two-component system phosphate regulon response regulator OmpR